MISRSAKKVSNHKTAMSKSRFFMTKSIMRILVKVAASSFLVFQSFFNFLQDEQQSTGGHGTPSMVGGGPSLWNSNLVSNLGESQTSPSNTNTSSASEKQQSTSKSSTSKVSKRTSNKSKSKLSRVRYFLHPGEPPVGQIVSDSLTDGQDNNNTLSLKQPQVILPNSYI